MVLSKIPYKGTRDFFPASMRLREYLFSRMKTAAESFGYEPYDAPLLEEVALYRAKSGQELIDQQIYSFTDRGGRKLAIRPEMTPSLARMVAQIHLEWPKPIRLYSIPNLYRYERPQRGRVREHWQFNCDIFGENTPYGEMEILQVAIALMEGLGADDSHFEILLNDRKIVDNIFQKKMGLPCEKAIALMKVLDKTKKVSEEKLQSMIDEVGLDKNQKKIFNDYINQDGFPNSFKSFTDWASKAGLKKHIKYDPSIVRGMDYYTGIIFEIYDKHPDNRRAIAGGGSYEGLMQLFGEPALPGVGLGMGDVTLQDFIEVHNLKPDFTKPGNDLFLSFQFENCRSEVFQLANTLRKRKIKVVNCHGILKINKVFS
ncbi:MAG: histidine--tRNA ligase, partial [Halobacteriovoraceae bacterium]|nr:histidine--tRNA ligase [Halobacteriovoraceae bacterium]